MKELTSTGIASPDSGAGALVLVVEDDEAARLTTSITLERAGYQVMEAADCASARARFTERKPDIVLLDVLLPDGDGYSLCRSGKLRFYWSNCSKGSNRFRLGSARW